MNNKMLENATINVSLGQSRYGTPEPQATLRFAKKTHYRILRAALLSLAAEIEASTPMSESWTVQIDELSDDRGRVFLDLIQGGEPEVERGLALLRKVVG